jgi:hypothetical protein
LKFDTRKLAERNGENLMQYCPKCGKEANDEDEYCTKCRTPLKDDIEYRRVRRRDADWWDSNDEDEKYGALIGGGIIIWLGTLLLLQNQGILRGDFGGYFLMGIGVILALRGVIALQAEGQSDTATGFLVGGGIMLLIGAGITYNIQDWWAFLLIGLGLLVVYRGTAGR